MTTNDTVLAWLRDNGISALKVLGVRAEIRYIYTATGGQHTCEVDSPAFEDLCTHIPDAVTAEQDRWWRSVRGFKIGDQIYAPEDVVIIRTDLLAAAQQDVV